VGGGEAGEEQGEEGQRHRQDAPPLEELSRSG
jgi:hypothetical protein